MSATAIVAIANSLAVMALTLALALQWKSMKADHERRKKQATLDFWASPGLTSSRRELRAAVEQRFGNDRLTKSHVQEVAEDSEEHRMLSNFLSLLEYFSVGINMKIFDFDVANRMSGGYMINMHTYLQPFIESRRRGNPRVYTEFSALVRKLQAQRAHPVSTDGDIEHS